MKWLWTQGALRDLIITVLPKYFQSILKDHKDSTIVLRLNPDGSCKLTIIGDEDAD